MSAIETGHRVSHEDKAFRRAFERCEIASEDFDHPAHVRLAYIYLCETNLAASGNIMKNSLLRYLNHLGIGSAKYHETLTQAWIKAVAYFMARCNACDSASDFMSQCRQLLDSKIMLTHYSAQRLFSEKARNTFVEPDIQSIPQQVPTQSK